MADFSYTSNVTQGPIRNPYLNTSANTSSINTSYRSLSSSTSITETAVRTWIRSSKQSAGDIPSLSSTEALRDQSRQPHHLPWSSELALEFGSAVQNCLRCCCIDVNPQPCGEPSNTDRVGAAVLELLARVVEDWDDHVLYAVLVQANRSSSNHHDSSPSVAIHKENLIDTLTRLCLLPENNNTQPIEPSHTSRNFIRRAAIVCLATAWRCLDRLEQYTTLANDHTGFSWWISDQKTIDSLAIASFRSLFRLHGCSDAYTSGSDPCGEFGLHNPHASAPFDIKQETMSALTILTILLRYQLLNLSTSSVSNTISRSIANDGCILPTRTLTELISKLIKEVQILNHSILPSASSEYTLPNAMLSMSILSLLQRSLPSFENDSLFHGLVRTIQSTGLVENLVQFTFSPSFQLDGSGSQTPRWISTASKRFRTGYLQMFGFHLLSCLRLCQCKAWRVVVANLEPKLPSMIDPFWSNLLKSGSIHHRNQSVDDSNHLEGQFVGLLWLYNNLHGNARYRLHCVLKQTLQYPGGTSNPFSSQRNDRDIEKSRALRKLIQSLFSVLRLSSGAPYTARLMTSRLIRILLTDRRIGTSNDELSRSLWQAVDQSIVELHLESVLEHADTDDVNQPLLVTLVDTMETLLEYEEQRDYLVDKLAAHNLETLIYLIKPQDVRYDFNLGIDDEVADSNTETPPLNNLSRMDETSMCIEHEETKDPKGLDHSVRLSVATSLARLAYGTSAALPTESVGLLISRISSAVYDFLAEYHDLIEGGGKRDDKTNITIVTTPSNDQVKRFMRLQHECAIPENEEFLSGMMFTSISHRNKKISQMVNAQQEAERNVQIAQQQANEAQEEKVRLVQRISVQSVLFEREVNRTKLNALQEARQAVSMHASERSCAEERAKKLQIQTEQEKVELERAKTEAQNAINELQSTKSKVEELNGTIGTLQQELKDEKAKSNEIAQKVEANRDAIVSFEEKCGDMQNIIDEKEDAISRMDDKNHRLQNDLEDLFADMCSLAQIHKHKETEEESQKKMNTAAIDAVNEELTVERRRNEELSSKMKDIKEENDKLYRKLAKYKERLEQERNERREEQSRRREEDHRRKRSGPVSYLNSLHESSSSDVAQSRSKHTRSLQDVSSSDIAQSRSKHTRSSRDLSSSSSSDVPQSRSKHTRSLRDLSSSSSLDVTQSRSKHTRSLRDLSSSDATQSRSKHTRSLRDVSSSDVTESRSKHTRSLRDVSSSAVTESRSKHTRSLRDVSSSQRERPPIQNKVRERSENDKENTANRSASTHRRSIRSQRKIDY
eukprot:jgi/Psemu1/250383/estExt_Genewise1Plus.C_150155